MRFAPLREPASFGFCATLAMAVLFVPQSALGEPLAVDSNDQAQAYNFTRRGVCYAIFPEHITQRSRFDVSTASPPRTGTVDIFDFMRFPMLDLAVGQVYGAAAAPCAPDLASSHFDNGGLLASETIASLSTMATSGRVERLPVRITAVDYTHIEFDVIRDKDRGRVGQGRSGSMIMIGERPVAMLVDVSDETVGGTGAIRALRFDAAIGWLGRFLDRNVTRSPSLAPENTAEEMAYEVATWSANPVDGAADPRSLSSDLVGSYVIAPGDLPATIELSLGAQARDRGVGGIVIESHGQNDATTPPRSIRVVVRRSEGGTFRPLSSGTGDSGGHTEIPIRSQKIRVLRIIIESGWNATLPVRLDRIRILAGG